MAVVRQQANAEELLHMPDAGFRYELVRGELRQKTPAGNVHGRITVRVTWRLARYVEENRLGNVYAAETGFRLATDPDTVRAPDVASPARKQLSIASVLLTPNPLDPRRNNAPGASNGASLTGCGYSSSPA